MARAKKKLGSNKAIIIFTTMTWLIIMAPLARAYHPMLTDDPGATEFRHFEFEWGNDLLYPNGSMDDYSGYAAIKSGLAPGLEFDAALGYTGWRDVDEVSTSGYGDAQLLFKWRFLGDGDGPNNLALEAVFDLPSGEESKELRGGDEIVPTIFLIATTGTGDLRVLLNAGMTVLPDENDVALGGLGLEWAAADRWTLVSEIYAEGDFERGGDNDPVLASVGALYSAGDWLTLSSGVIFGCNDDAPDYQVTLAALFAW